MPKMPHFRSLPILCSCVNALGFCIIFMLFFSKVVQMRNPCGFSFVLCEIVISFFVFFPHRLNELRDYFQIFLRKADELSFDFHDFRL